ncbi:ATP-binding protein [Vulcanococcus limneticus]|uniref:ATP-binding protein n=1 Tax=Vulcanococcus limneticus TaxID=2170428 RepID=UPI00398BD52C
MQHPDGEAQAEFPSTLDAMAELLEWFEQKRPGGLDDMVWIQAQTALMEGFTNAVRHAHGLLETPPVVGVTLSLVGSQLRLGIRDHGAPFDLEALWREQVTQGEEPLGLDGLPERESHWGLIILRRLQRDYGWSIRYEPLAGGGNMLLLEGPGGGS